MPKASTFFLTISHLKPMSLVKMLRSILHTAITVCKEYTSSFNVFHVSLPTYFNSAQYSAALLTERSQ